MNIILLPFFEILYRLLDLYFWIVLVTLLMGLLINYGVINGLHPFVKSLFSFCGRLVYPLLRPIQKILPPLGNVDLSPLVLILLVSLLQGVIRNIMASLM